MFEVHPALAFIGSTTVQLLLLFFHKLSFKVHPSAPYNAWPRAFHQFHLELFSNSSVFPNCILNIPHIITSRLVTQFLPLHPICCLSPRQLSPMTRAYAANGGGGDFPRKSERGIPNTFQTCHNTHRHFLIEFKVHARQGCYLDNPGPCGNVTGF